MRTSWIVSSVIALSLLAGPAMAFRIDDGGQSRDGTTFSVEKTYTKDDRFDYNRALTIYSRYVQMGKVGLIKPDINDRATVDFYLNGLPTVPAPRVKGKVDPFSTNDYVKPPDDLVDITRLSGEMRAALIRSWKVGRCWNYPNFPVSFVEMCKKYIKGKKELSTSGFVNDIQGSRIYGRAILEDTSASGRSSSSSSARYLRYLGQ